MNNWELKIIAVLIITALVSVLAAYLQKIDAFSGNAPIITGSVLVGVGGIPFFASGAVLLVSSFQQSALSGWLFLLLPFYSVYYVLNRYEGFYLGLLRLGWIGGGLLTITGVIILCLHFLL